ncbi:MAG TPA: MBL fold metallo-hydrolase [Thermoanaerobaculia bacterium]|nr:MBL fold metallo-hydrolase [Thermoanaerobaculia bacterium]
MKPLFHPRLINDPFGDPGVYIDFLFEKRALLFDLGDLHALSSRQLLKVTHTFVSHAHMDHFSGFDSMLRVLLGREKRVHLFGPPGFLDRVEHKLAAYTWNLVESYENELLFRVTEVGPGGSGATAGFSSRRGFRRSPATTPVDLPGGVLVDEETFRVRTAVLDHRIPCLGFALEEKFHVNVWKSGLERLGLPTGPWLRDLKSAVARGDADDTPIAVRWRDNGEPREVRVPLGTLRAQVLRIVPGQKIAYVTDVVYHAANAAAIIELAQDADLLFIEATFAADEAERAAEKHHLTSRQAGLLGRRAGAKRLVPFHFSPKHSEEGDRLLREALEAFAGNDIAETSSVEDKSGSPSL